MLDKEPYLNVEYGGREKDTAELATISSTVGFFYLKNHGIPMDVLDRIFAESRRVHALPAEEKAKFPEIVTDTFKSGYKPGDEHRPGSNVNIIKDAKPNLYSRFSINREGGSGGLSVPPPANSPNVWPENLPGFAEIVLDSQARRE